MKPIPITASCGHEVHLDPTPGMQVREAERRTQILQAEVCLVCWREFHLWEANMHQQEAGLPHLASDGDTAERFEGIRARHQLFPATARLIGERQQSATGDDWQRLAAVLVALRRETSAARWAGWRWMTPNQLIADVSAWLERAEQGWEQPVGHA